MTTQMTRYCLKHQRPELHTSPIGPVCEICKREFYLQNGSINQEDVQGYWLSQPEAYQLDQQPIFVYVRQVGKMKIRSLVPEEQISLSTHSESK